MKLIVIAFKNKAIGASTTPVYTDVDAEKSAVQLARSLTVCDEEKAKPYHGLVMYQIGTYDDVAMKLESIEPIELLDCDTILDKRKEKEDGGENKEAN